MSTAVEAPGSSSRRGIVIAAVIAEKVERYLACDKVPQAARDGAKQGLDALKGAWGDTDFPPEVLAAASDACLQAVDALTQGASAMGCTI